MGQWRWTGFEKTLWDWLQLLIVPVMIALVGAGFTAAQGYIQLQAEERSAQAQRDAEEQRAQDEALQACLDGMGNLLLEEGLLSSQEGEETSTLARARTLTLLRRVDGDRKGSVVQFLYESQLIEKDKPIVSLSGADLTDANLNGTDLTDANLNGTDLTDARLRFAVLRDVGLWDTNLLSAHLFKADLSGADLREADLNDADLSRGVLSGADLSEAELRSAELMDADLSGAVLSGADLSEAELRSAEARAYSLSGTTMPDGSVHD